MWEIYLIIFIIIALVIIFKKKEYMISKAAYTQLYNGLNLPVSNGNYLGGLGIIWNAENASTVNDIKL